MPFRILACLVFIVIGAMAVHSQTTAAEFYQRGIIQLSSVKWDEAIADFTKAIQLNYEDPGKAYLMRGIAYQGKNDLDAAWADATKALTLSKSSELVHRLRGEVASSQSKFDIAIAEFTKMIELEPKGYAGYTLRASARNKKGDKDGAISDYSTAISLNPPYAHDRHINRAWVYHSKGEMTKAFADFDKAVELAPGYLTVYLSRGYAHYQSKNYSAALTDFNKALAINPDHADLHHYMGHLYDNTEKFDLAAAAFSKAILAEPKRAEFYNDRGIVYRNQMKFQESLSDFLKATELAPENAQYTRSLVWMNLILGKPELSFAEADGVLDRSGMKGYGSYSAIAGFLALRKSKTPGQANPFLQKWIARSEPGTWPETLLKFLNGQLTVTQLLAAAVDNEKETEARSIAGTVALLDGKRDLAATHFEWVKSKGTKMSFLYTLAVAESNRALGQAQ